MKRLKLAASALLALLLAPAVLATQEGRRGAQLVESRHGNEEVVSAVVQILNEVGCSRAPCHTHKVPSKVLGLMEVDLAYAEVNRTRRAYYVQMVLLALGTVVVTAVLLTLLIRRWFSQPVALLVESTRQIAAGDLNHRIPELDGELGELARAFSRMQEQLRLKSAPHELERRPTPNDPARPDPTRP